MGLKRYPLVVLLYLLGQWGIAPGWSAVAELPPAHCPPVSSDVFPLAIRYREEVRARVAQAELPPAPPAPAERPAARGWSGAPAEVCPPRPVPARLVYLLMSLRC